MSADSTQRVALPRELGDFLIELSIALQRSAMYPPGHPSLEDSARQLMTRATGLLLERSELSIGVARRQLVIEGVATDARNPVLRTLAERLHRHHIGALLLRRGLRGADLQEALFLLAHEPGGEDRPLGLGDPAQLRRWSGVELYPLTYDQLELVEGEGEDGSDGAARNARLWVGLAHAALATRADGSRDESGGAAAAEPAAAEAAGALEPAVVARAINERAGAKAYDQVIVGYMLQIARELRDGRGATSAQPLRRRMARLLGELEPAALERLLHMGGDAEQRFAFLEQVVDGFAADAVIEVVRAAAGTTHQTVSHAMIRLLTKLADTAEGGEEAAARMEADAALRDQVRDLIRDWRLSDPNPEAYTRALEHFSHGRGDVPEPAVEDAAGVPDANARAAPEPERMVAMALEVDAVGVPFWRACEALLAAGRVDLLVGALQHVEHRGDAAGRLQRWLMDPERLLPLLTAERPDFAALEPLLSGLPARTHARLLFDAINASEHRPVRLALLARVIRLGDAAAEAAAAYLGDERWFVLRNALFVLRRVGHVPAGVNVVPLARHAHESVRAEAIAVLIGSPADRERGICMALADPGARVLATALERIVAIGRAATLSETAFRLLVKRLEDASLSADSRAHLVRIAGGAGARGFELLLGIASRRTLFGRRRLRPRSPELLAALHTLRAHWPADAAVAALLAQAWRSRDAEVRAAAGGT